MERETGKDLKTKTKSEEEEGKGEELAQARLKPRNRFKSGLSRRSLLSRARGDRDFFCVGLAEQWIRQRQRLRSFAGGGRYRGSYEFLIARAAGI